jgi:hypothetical protein
MSVPYTHDDLGEDDYRPAAGPGVPDRRIDDQEPHVPFYGLGQVPVPYPE